MLEELSRLGTHDRLNGFASDQDSMRRLDSLLMKQGQYVLPGVRRFVSTVHTELDLEDSLRGLDMACREFCK